MNEHVHALSESLRREADGVDVGTVPALEGIRGRAGRIRRRRRLVTASVAAAAVAVLAPVAWTLTADQRTDSLPPAGPTGSVTPSPTSPTSSPSPTSPTSPTGKGGSGKDMNLRGLTSGQDVGIGWLDMTGSAWTVHPTSGDTFEVEVPGDSGVVVEFAGLSDGRWVAQTSERALLVWDRNGTLQHQEKAADEGLAVDQEHSTVAWADATGRPRVLMAGSGAPLTLLKGQTGFRNAVAVDTSRADCTTTVGDGPSCSVLFNTESDGPVNVTSTGVLSPASGSEASGNSMLSASDAWLDDNGISGMLAGRDRKTLCGDLMLFASEPGDPTCTRIYGIFSPDGKRLTVDADSPERSDGDAGSTRLGVFDTTTYTMAWNRTPGDDPSGDQASIRDRQWINGTDLAAVVWQQDAWSLVRFDASGRALEVAPAVTGEALRPLYALETQP